VLDLLSTSLARTKDDMLWEKPAGAGGGFWIRQGGGLGENGVGRMRMKRWWRLLWIVAASVLPGAPGHGVPVCPLPASPTSAFFGTDLLANGNPMGSGGDSYQYQPLDRLVSGDGGAIALGWDATSSPPAPSPPRAEERGREWWGTVHPGWRLRPLTKATRRVAGGNQLAESL